MTHVLMIPVMHAISSMRIVAADADDTMNVLHAIMTVVTVILTGAHVITTEGMDVNLVIMTAAMMISGIESQKDLSTSSGRVHNLQMPCYIAFHAKLSRSFVAMPWSLTHFMTSNSNFWYNEIISVTGLQVRVHANLSIPGPRSGSGIDRY